METAETNKTIVITGATSGIGLAAAEQLASQGHFVIGVGRSAERCRWAESHLRDLNPNSEAVYLVADLSLQSQVRELAARIRETLARNGRTGLDALINNAGTFTYWLALTAEGYETQWAVNYLAPFLLTCELLPLLQAAPAGRVVLVSSASHYGSKLDWNDLQLRRHYNGLKAYGQTKLAEVLFALELNRRLGEGSSVRAFAADPGLVKTEIGFKATPGIVSFVWNLRRSGGIPAEESARGIVYLATEPSIQTSAEVYWKHGKPVRASRQGLDAQAAERLWAVSEKMCGVVAEA